MDATKVSLLPNDFQDSFINNILKNVLNQMIHPDGCLGLVRRGYLLVLLGLWLCQSKDMDFIP
jgi:hypothetical protein